MNHFPAIIAKDLVKILQQVGFKEHHQKGSHKVFRRETDRKRVIVPFHSGRIVPRKTLKAILMDAGLTADKIKEPL